MCDHALNASVLIIHHTYIESSYKTEKSKKQNKQDVNVNVNVFLIKCYQIYTKNMHKHNPYMGFQSCTHELDKNE